MNLAHVSLYMYELLRLLSSSIFLPVGPTSSLRELSTVVERRTVDLSTYPAGMQELKTTLSGLVLVPVEGATHGGERGILGRPEFLDALRRLIVANKIGTTRR